jgi:hypothetical protein
MFPIRAARCAVVNSRRWRRSVRYADGEWSHEKRSAAPLAVRLHPSVDDLRGAWEMNPIKMVALVLVVAGALALAYGGFSYTRETQEAKLGPIELSVKERETVNIPVWAGVAAIVTGGALLIFRSKKS